MDDLLTILGVVALFLIRIGIPVILLVGLGLLIDRWQSKRETDIERERRKPIAPHTLRFPLMRRETDIEREKRKSA